LVEDADDLAGPNAAFKDKKPVNDNQFDIEDSVCKVYPYRCGCEESRIDGDSFKTA